VLLEDKLIASRIFLFECSEVSIEVEIKS
jgi:hypothetical protein